MPRLLFIVIVLFESLPLHSQKSILNIKFVPVFNGNDLALNKEYKLADSSIIKIETLKFYLSNIKLISGEKVVFEEKKSYRLLDLENQNTLIFNIKYKIKKFDKIRFCIGLDSLTNVSGALAGDLDPTKGMYWTWQSGYINFKLEGYADKSKNRNGKFQYHLGGYLYPFNSLQNLTYSVNDKNKLQFDFSVDQFLNFVDFEYDSEIMSPCHKAVELSKRIKENITVHR